MSAFYERIVDAMVHYSFLKLPEAEVFEFVPGIGTVFQQAPLLEAVCSDQHLYKLLHLGVEFIGVVVMEQSVRVNSDWTVLRDVVALESLVLFS